MNYFFGVSFQSFSDGYKTITSSKLDAFMNMSLFIVCITLNGTLSVRY